MEGNLIFSSYILILVPIAAYMYFLRHYSVLEVAFDKLLIVALTIIFFICKHFNSLFLHLFMIGTFFNTCLLLIAANYLINKCMRYYFN